RRILAFHIVSQVGYMLLAIALGTKAAFAGAVFYTLHHILAKTNLFLVSATVAKLTGYFDLRRTGGLYGSHPWLGVLFLIPALAMVGVPPLSGFWAKFIVLREGLEGMHYLWVSAAVITGFLTLYSMMKIWFEAFLKRRPGALFRPDPNLNLAPAYVAITIFSACTVLIGLFPEALLTIIERAIDTLAIIGGEVPNPYDGGLAP
ncbi:MAG: Na+/H+ antiporter subunit D, partial [Sandaracinaceae bacterium]|nr:Na+/H+ antiporter subunit D [Sandaracinaceae bacterium]